MVMLKDFCEINFINSLNKESGENSLQYYHEIEMCEFSCNNVLFYYLNSRSQGKMLRLD